MRHEHKFATYYRVLGMIFILLCHFTQESTNPYLNMSAQFFNIGVPMFIILSGFLFGIHGGQSKYTVQWLKRRFMRIFIPYELFLSILLIIHLFSDKYVMKWDWLWLILGIQGSVVGIQGAEQTWFITTILLCYLVTPLFDKCCFESIHNKRNVIKGLLVFTPTILAVLPVAYMSTLFSPICWYGLAYFVGNEYKRIRISAKSTCCAVLLICGSFGIRVIARMLFDGTILYDRIVVPYTQTIAAFAILYVVAFFTKEMQLGYCMHLLSSISFEVYLYHYMFCVGPVKLFGVTENWLTDCCLISTFTIVIACIMKRVSNIITQEI